VRMKTGDATMKTGGVGVATMSESGRKEDSPAVAAVAAVAAAVAVGAVGVGDSNPEGAGWCYWCDWWWVSFSRRLGEAIGL